MKLYVGSRNYRPLGYKTLDIDPTHSPDYLEDVTNVKSIGADSCDEIVASHVLEHISWPDSFKALAEFARLLKVGGQLKIAVPDVISLLQSIQSGNSDFWAMGLIYGVGGRDNDLEVHRYGFTQRMLIEILTQLGFGTFEWWNSKEHDGSNGWMPRSEFLRAGISLNICCKKLRNPPIPSHEIFTELLNSPLQSFDSAIALTVARLGIEFDALVERNESVYQDIHYKLIEANQRIAYLEELIKSKNIS